MHIEIYTKKGDTLIKDIFKAVEDETVKTWLVKKDAKGNKYLTHKPEQWCDKALPDLTGDSEKVNIRIAWWKDKEPAEDIKGYYIGRFTELLLVSFSDKFGKFEIHK